MILVLYQHHIRHAALLCDSRTKPIYNKNPEEPFLEIDVKGGERDHIKAYHFRESITFSGGERDLQGERILVESISQGSQMLGVQEERCHMSS